MLGKWISKKCLQKIKVENQEAPEEHEQAIALLSDNLQDRDKHIQDAGLQGEIHAKDQLTEKCKNTITHLEKRHVDHARNTGKDNIIIIVQKNAILTTIKYHDLHIMYQKHNGIRGI